MGALFNDLKEVLTPYSTDIKNRYTKAETNALLSNAADVTSAALNAIREDISLTSEQKTALTSLLD